MKILIVEDDVNSRIYLERALLSQGYSVVSAANGVKAIEKAKQSPPDLIISDIMMPEMDGFELCRKLKEDERLKTTPFVFYTATYIEPKDEKLAMALGASRFLVKPMEMDDLFTAIKSVIDEHLEKSLELPVQTLAEKKELDRMQLEVLARKLDKKVRQLEEEREVSRRRGNKYHKLLKSMINGFLYVDMNGTIREFNETFKKILGYDDEDLKHLVYTDITLKKWQGLERKIIQDQVLSRGYSDNYEVEYQRKDGTIFPVELHTYLIKNEQGENEGMWVIVRDITERKKAEEELQLYEYIVSSSSDMMALLDNKFTYLAVNTAYTNAFGRDRDEIVGYTVAEVFGESFFEKTIKSYAERCLAGEEIHYDQWFDFPVSGRQYVSMAYFPFYKEKNVISGFAVVGRDISGRKNAEDAKVILEKKLLQAQKMESVGHLAGGVAHDFNNMLGVILGHTEMALEEIDPALSLYESLQAVQHAAEHSADLTRQLLTFARKQTISPKVIDLNETVEETLNMLRRLIGEDINLFWQPGINLQPIKIDPSQVNQLLTNLCVNARDAVDGVGKVTIITDAKTVSKDYCHDQLGALPGEYILLEVSDDGCGMDKKTLDHIFEPFFTTKEQGKGTGLGLASIYGIVKQNNGFINVYSELDQGTTFKIYLPVYAAKSAEVAEKAHDLPAEQHGSETILLVEDESVILKMTTTMLTRLGYNVVAAATPGEAIRLAHEYRGRIDLLMTDVVMPEMNGRELAGNLLSHYPDLKRLFMSGYTANVIAHHGVLDKGVHFIQKPFSKKDLGRKLREVLEG